MLSGSCRVGSPGREPAPTPRVSGATRALWQRPEAAAHSGRRALGLPLSGQPLPKGRTPGSLRATRSGCPPAPNSQGWGGGERHFLPRDPRTE